LNIVVQKYGGSSLADTEHLKRVAERIMATVSAGHRVVVVVSAMGKTTNDLLALAKQVAPNPPQRELDMLLTTGERISMALLSMAIRELGGDAISFTGSQAGIITTDRHVDARIIEVRPQRVEEELERGRVVIVAGYQGVSSRREVTTLGRGGSDTTAVALAAALGAQWCEICSDVDGVYTADPRVVPDARRTPELSYGETQEMAESGAKVLNAQAVEFAKEKGIEIFARATSSSPLTDGTKDTGTRVCAAPGRESGTVTGVSSETGLTLLEGRCEPDELLALLDELGVPAKQLHIRDGGRAISMVISGENLHHAEEFHRSLREKFPDRQNLRTVQGIGAVSVIGSGINQSHNNLARGQRAIENCGSDIRECFTSSFRITWLMPAAHIEAAARALHTEFF